ncbi:hypothetical protein [Lactococcus lactis]|uniref:hypothetical protein n=1 Tax=Lactococcus lactis TaxID=1358 RepID=UPI00289FBB26|nr:hypothetical protein [Lactococcus lactis]
MELSLQKILNEIHLIQDSLANKDSSNSNKNKTSQELLHKKLDDAEEKQKKKPKKESKLDSFKNKFKGKGE